MPAPTDSADLHYPEHAIGNLMEPLRAVFSPATSVASAIEQLREMVQQGVISYGYLVDEKHVLLGVFAFRELLFAEPQQTLAEISHMAPFALRDTMPLDEAMQEAVTRHFPVYPVCDSNGVLVGAVRGHVLFEAQAFVISAQAGMMQGVDSDERLATPWLTSLKFRHPWLLLNLLTAFIAAAVVGIFENTLSHIIVLAAFLPVLAGQSGNTGCQALAVTLRGMTLGELKTRTVTSLVWKEAVLGFCNGLLVGLVAGAGMWFYASQQGAAAPLLLGFIVWVSMVGACLISGVCGALIPLTLKRLGADPATASSIFLTTMTDVVSMGVFLGLATLLVL